MLKITVNPYYKIISFLAYLRESTSIFSETYRKLKFLDKWKKYFLSHPSVTKLYTIHEVNFPFILHSGTCPGDSGGPLFDLVFINSTFQQYIQYGIVHGSIRPCDGSTYPGIFVRLTERYVWEFIHSLGQIHSVSVYNTTQIGT